MGKMRRMQKWIRRLSLCGAIWLLLWAQNQLLQSETITVRTQIPTAFSGLRITVLADLHGAVFGPDNRELIRVVQQTKPDLIAICGDFADMQYDPAMIQTMTSKLCAVAPVYYVTGNHEWAARIVKPLTAQLTAAGVTVLANDYVVLERAGERLVLAGVHDPNGPRDMKTPRQLAAEIKKAEGNLPTILLAHRNDRLEEYAACGFSVVLCGHGHGGVWRLPWVGGLLGPGGAWRPFYDAGVYRQKNTIQVVSRGLGRAKWLLRLGNRPQVLTVVLES